MVASDLPVCQFEYYLKKRSNLAYQERGICVAEILFVACSNALAAPLLCLWLLLCGRKLHSRPPRWAALWAVTQNHLQLILSQGVTGQNVLQYDKVIDAREQHLSNTYWLSMTTTVDLGSFWLPPHFYVRRCSCGCTVCGNLLTRPVLPLTQSHSLTHSLCKSSTHTHTRAHTNAHTNTMFESWKSFPSFIHRGEGCSHFPSSPLLSPPSRRNIWLWFGFPSAVLGGRSSSG